MVECLRMGGAFGGKEVQANAWAAIAALGTWKTKRPVRVRLTRALDMALTGKRHPFLTRYRAGFTREGKLEASASRFIRRRLEPGSIRQFWRARFSTPITRICRRDFDRLRVPHPQDFANHIPRIRRTAGDAGDRRDYGSGGATLGAPAESCAHASIARRCHPLWPDGWDAGLQTIWTQLLRTSAFEERRAA
jgi:hypothetical protein